jgi:hypothetical protein
MRAKELTSMVAAALALAVLARSAMPSPPAASVASSSILRVRVRVDTRAAERHVRLADLMDTVRAIWKPYADIVFADTADLGGDGYDEELQLVVSGRPGSAASGASALGWITFAAPGRPADFVTVSVATAQTLMARNSWMGRRFELLPPVLRQQLVTRAVGWSAAHEIGHYLLRTDRHAPDGLMKAQLTAADVMQNGQQWVGLDLRDAETLRTRASRAGLQTRLRLEPPADEP